MFDVAFALTATALLCLAFATTRWVGIVGIALLIASFPVASFLLLLAGLAGFLLYHLNQRS
jgi:hypothetical protein